MRKILWLLLIVAGAAALLSGCGKEESAGDTTRLDFKKDGQIVHTIVEDFSQDYYSLDELKENVEEQIAEYNGTAGKGGITLDSAEVEEGLIRLVMTFPSAENYSGFYRQALFYGTVKDAFNAGYDLDIQLRGVGEEGTVVGRQEILEMGEKHIVVVREKIQIKTYGNILYVSSDVEPLENGKEANVTDKENLSYIIFE